MWACVVSALLAAALSAPALAEHPLDGATRAPKTAPGGVEASAELAPGAFLFLDIDGCRACEGSFTVSETLGGDLEITTLTEAGFLMLLNGEEPATELTQLSGRASPSFASSSFQEVIAPAYIVIRCPVGARARCVPRWRLQVQQSETYLAAKFFAVERTGGRASPSPHPGTCGKNIPGLPRDVFMNLWRAGMGALGQGQAGGVGLRLRKAGLV